MKKTYLFLLSLIFLLPLLSQEPTAESYKVSGYIKMEDGKNLAGASVWIEKENFSTTTDINGFFSFYLNKKGKFLLMVQHKGFELKKIPVIIKDKDVFIPGIFLNMKKLNYEVRVSRKISKIMSTTDAVGTVILKPAELAGLPSMGEPDIFRSLQLLPGINAGGESSGLYVRGGKPDQNLITYDGFTVYHVDHFFGIFSAFNSNSIDNIKLNKGGFSSEFGGRLSSVMELTGKLGNPNKFSAGVGITFLSANAFISTPLGKRGSLFLSGRRSFKSPLYTSLLENLTGNENSGRGNKGGLTSKGGGSGFGALFESDPISYFYDLNGKLSYNISSKDLWTISFYNGKDNLDNSREITALDFEKPGADPGYEINVEGEYTDITRWGNTGLSFNWLRQWSSNFSSNATFAWSKYFNRRDLNSTERISFIIDPDAELPQKFIDSLEGGKNSEAITFIDNDLKDYTFRFNNSWNLNKKNRIGFGFFLTSNEINYVYSTTNVKVSGEDPTEPLEPENILDIHEKGTLSGFYIQDRIKLFKSLTITPGIRLTNFDRTDKWYIEPRFSFMLDLSKKLKLKGAYGKYYQFTNNIVREDIMQGDQDFWTISDGDTVPVSSAIHYIAGLSYEIKNYLFDIEYYYKKLDGLTEFSFRTTGGQEDINYNDYFFVGSGISKGIEFLIQKKHGNLTGWICYTHGEVESNFPDISETSFPASHNVKHELKLVANYQVKKWNLSATWIYASGRSFTTPLSVTEQTFYYEESEKEVIRSIVEFGPKNGSNLPDYHRLDLSVTRDFKIGSIQTSAGISVFNVYNQRNILRYEYEVAENEFIRTEVNYLGITPSIFFKISF